MCRCLINSTWVALEDIPTCCTCLYASVCIPIYAESAAHSSHQEKASEHDDLQDSHVGCHLWELS